MKIPVLNCNFKNSDFLKNCKIKIFIWSLSPRNYQMYLDNHLHFEKEHSTC